MRRYGRLFVVGMAVVALLAGVLGGCDREEAVERSYNTACYREQGGDKWVCGSGGEFEVQSGATLDIQSGATTDFSSGVDMDGGLLTLDANGNTSIQADTDDQIDIEISGADDFQFTANVFELVSGSSVRMNGGVLDLDADEDTSLTASTDDQIDIEIGGADVAVFKDLTATALTDTVEYMLEIVDATGIGQSGTNSQAALNIDLALGDSTAGTNTVYGILIDNLDRSDNDSTDTAIRVAGNNWDYAADFDAGVTIDGGVTNIGGGTPGVALGDNDLYVTEVLEVDSEIENDGTLDQNGNATFAGSVTLEAGSVLVGSDYTTGTHGLQMVAFGAFTQAISETETSILSIPANANITDVMLHVGTSWDDGASAALDIGPEGSVDTWMDDYDLNGAASGTIVRLDETNIDSDALGDVGASVLDIHCVIALGNGSQTAGSATLYVWYQIDE